MIQIFMTENGTVHQKDEPQAGAWIALTDPTATEILEVSQRYGIDPDHVRAPLDEEERSRIEVEDSIPWCWWISPPLRNGAERTGM